MSDSRAARTRLVWALEEASSAATRWLEHYTGEDRSPRERQAANQFYLSVTHALDSAAEEVPR